MRSKIFQEILDETPEDVEIFVRLYADLVVRINQLLLENNISKIYQIQTKMSRVDGFGSSSVASGNARFGGGGAARPSKQQPSASMNRSQMNSDFGGGSGLYL